MLIVAPLCQHKVSAKQRGRLGGVVTHPVWSQVDAALLALSEGFGQPFRVTKNKLHIVMVHQHTRSKNRKETLEPADCRNQNSFQHFLCASKRKSAMFV